METGLVWAAEGQSRQEWQDEGERDSSGKGERERSV